MGLYAAACDAPTKQKHRGPGGKGTIPERFSWTV